MYRLHTHVTIQITLIQGLIRYPPFLGFLGFWPFFVFLGFFINSRIVEFKKMDTVQQFFVFLFILKLIRNCVNCEMTWIRNYSRL